MSESGVSLPKKYIDLTEGATSHWAVSNKLLKMVKPQDKVTSNDAEDDGSGLLKSDDGIYLADMRNLNNPDTDARRKGMYFDLVYFKKKYDRDFCQKKTVIKNI